METFEISAFYLKQLDKSSMAAIGFIFGIVFGSFITVLVHRIPLILENSWRQSMVASLKNWGIPATIYKTVEQPSSYRVFNIARPRSHCPKCSHQLLTRHLIPIISFLMLKGRCQFCKTSICIKYPLIEVISGILTAYIFYLFEFTLMAAGSCVLIYILVALTFIDLAKKILPDSLTLSLVWLGFVFNLITKNIGIEESIIGAISGYIFLQTVAMVFKLITAKEGLGQGDIKLTAGLGAWVGWPLLPALLVVSSSLGIIFQCKRIFQNDNNKPHEFAFGPYLAVGGLTIFLWGSNINHLLFSYIYSI